MAIKLTLLSMALALAIALTTAAGLGGRIAGETGAALFQVERVR